MEADVRRLRRLCSSAGIEMKDFFPMSSTVELGHPRVKQSSSVNTFLQASGVVTITLGFPNISTLYIPVFPNLHCSCIQKHVTLLPHVLCME